ncbi:LysR family transcriptional regulator [Terasakiispira papahanaumokuakeensis]|uniref:HTH-type transcriptional regulator MetR n=1 Tax=Terasakiispira papahanaumokuakeensis TaxID=197479 RepID=A0A1E2V717_9GAMM|nr:LysR family transcriptional regulator [Terasakiispira papahanaumokuakeensis]ODC02808.1 LysR family transcriptional regulator [Terasakiispira papahanaumokuakeensis]
MIDRMHLRIMREIERQGSLTAAAQALHLTQPALSHTMKKLEAQLGAPLWVKEGRHLSLTQAGIYLQREASRLLPQLERVDQVLHEFALGEKGTMGIGMECHPCYQWLLTVVAPFLKRWPGVDVDVKQQFQFGGLAALFNHEIDVLVTPDPVRREGIVFEPVFPYEQVLVVHQASPLAQCDYVTPEQLLDQTLYTYPVATDRLDIFQHFLLPAYCTPKRHKTLEDTEMLLQMVVAHRGVATLPQWLVERYAETLPISPVRLGAKGIHKHIHLGIRTASAEDRHIQTLIETARTV